MLWAACRIQPGDKAHNSSESRRRGTACHCCGTYQDKAGDVCTQIDLFPSNQPRNIASHLHKSGIRSDSHIGSLGRLSIVIVAGSVEAA